MEFVDKSQSGVVKITTVDGGESEGGGGDWGDCWMMFEKVVTASDVGKLNRLVIPKQEAERNFPILNPSNALTILSFEDRSGNPWRFRYSYWSSSQSFVFTRGWTRFVKDKRLAAGDIVSFHRSRRRLFIDYRRQATVPRHRHDTSWNYSMFYPTVQSRCRDRYRYYYSYDYGSVNVKGQKCPCGDSELKPVVKRLRLFGVNVECSNYM